MRSTTTMSLVLLLAAALLIGIGITPSESGRRALYINPNVTSVNVTDDQVWELLQRTRFPDELWLFSLKVDGNGTLKPRNHSDFPSRVHRLHPSTTVLTAIGFDSRAYPLNDTTRVATLTATIADFVRAHQYDGIVLDMEPLQSGDPAYLAFIRDVKAALPGKRIGVYGFRLVETGSWYNWDAAYLTQIAHDADFVQLALYNTRTLAQAPDGTYSAATYQTWIRNQTTTTDLLGITDKIYWGMPAYKGSAAHIIAIENIGVAGPLLYNRHTAIYNEAYMTEADYDLYDAFLTHTLPPPVETS